MANGKFLYLIDDQEDPQPGRPILQAEFVKPTEHSGLVTRAVTNIECTEDHAEQAVRGELAGHYPRGHVAARIELCQQMIDERRFPGSDIAGDNDKAIALRQSVGQMRQRS